MVDADLRAGDALEDIDEKDERILDPDNSSGDDDPALRPKVLSDFTGQRKACELLEVYLSSALQRGQPLDHTLFYGPPGLGKTTLANIVANEMGAGFRSVSAPSIKRPGDLVSALVSLGDNDVFFIDEIHRLNVSVEEILYSAMEDFRLDIMLDDGMGGSRSVNLPLPAFTLVGATTKSGLLSRPLRERFGIDLNLEPYSDEDLATIVQRSADLLNIGISGRVAFDVACRSRATPRIANRLLRRVRDFALHAGDREITPDVAQKAFRLLEVDENGLDALDRRYIECLRDRFKGRAVGLKTLSTALNEDADTIENEVEPWLVMKGLVDRTPKGRILVNDLKKDMSQGNLL